MQSLSEMQPFTQSPSSPVSQNEEKYLASAQLLMLIETFEELKKVGSNYSLEEADIFITKLKLIQALPSCTKLRRSITNQ